MTSIDNNAASDELIPPRSVPPLSTKRIAKVTFPLLSLPTQNVSVPVVVSIVGCTASDELKIFELSLTDKITKLTFWDRISSIEL